jgi:hypothetical protein
VRDFHDGVAPVDSPEDYAVLAEEYGLDEVQEPKQTIPVERAMEILSREAAGAAGSTGAGG